MIVALQIVGCFVLILGLCDVPAEACRGARANADGFGYQQQYRYAFRPVMYGPRGFPNQMYFGGRRRRLTPYVREYSWPQTVPQLTAEGAAMPPPNLDWRRPPVPQKVAAEAPKGLNADQDRLKIEKPEANLDVHGDVIKRDLPVRPRTE